MNLDKKLSAIQQLKDDIAATYIRNIRNNLDKGVTIQGSTQISHDMIAHIGRGNAEKRVIHEIIAGMAKELENFQDSIVEQLDDQTKLEMGYNYRELDVYRGKMIVFSADDFEKLIDDIKALANYARRK